jgi:hypothetical protein
VHMLATMGDAREINLWVLTIEHYQKKIDYFDKMFASLMGEEHVEK